MEQICIFFQICKVDIFQKIILHPNMKLISVTGNLGYLCAQINKNVNELKQIMLA